jgi:hypothetical protein
MFSALAVLSAGYTRDYEALSRQISDLLYQRIRKVARPLQTTRRPAHSRANTALVVNNNNNNNTLTL